MRHQLGLRHVVALAAALTGACSDSTTPVTPAQAAGVYVLASVSGRGPSSGTFTLTADSRVERRVHYESRFSPSDQHLIGSFRLEGDSIAFDLIPGDMPADFVWSVSGHWLGSEFAIEYPDPADGPNIVERYRRQ